MKPEGDSAAGWSKASSFGVREAANCVALPTANAGQ